MAWGGGRRARRAFGCLQAAAGGETEVRNAQLGAGAAILCAECHASTARSAQRVIAGTRLDMGVMCCWSAAYGTCKPLSAM